jgi:hypothetical protein
VRILAEDFVHPPLAREPRDRNRVLPCCCTAPVCASRRSPACAGAGAPARDDGRQVTIFGMGGKTRTVLLADV